MELTAYCTYLFRRDGFQIMLSGKYPCVSLTKGAYRKQLLKGRSRILIHPMLLQFLISFAEGFVLFPPLSAAVHASDRTGT